MLDLALTEDYIQNIPWNDTSFYCFQGDNEEYKKAFQNILHKVPNTNNMVDFADDTWDFRPYIEDINSLNYVINFKSSEEANKYLKFYTIYEISKGVKISTIKGKIGAFQSIINKIVDEYKAFSLIMTDDLCQEVEERNIAEYRKRKYFSAIYEIYSFIIKNYKNNLPVDIKKLKERTETYSYSTDRNKHQDIPEGFYNSIIKTMISILNNDLLKDNKRMTAGLVIICSQTGLRVQDLLGLKTDALYEKYLPVSGVKCHYLHFQSRKPSKGNTKMLEFDIFASQLCVEAFNKMLEIRKNCIYAEQPYLYVTNPIKQPKKAFPETAEMLRSQYERIMYEFLYDEITKDWNGIQKTKSYVHNDPDSPNYKETYYSIPNFMQYRVHLATSLYNKGVSLTYIEKYLGHLSECMKGYYIRPKDKFQENADYANNIIRKIVNKDMTPLGSMGDELKRNLKEFVAKGKYNVETDTEQIMNDLGEKMVIREKGGGYCCIKTSIIPCKHDARTNEMMCAAGLCPNIYHFYDNIDVTYMTFKGLQDSYEANLKNGFEKAAQKELNKMKDFIRRRLKPEVDELEKAVSKVGIKKFCEENADLSAIVQNIEEIRREMAVWEKC